MRRLRAGSLAAELVAAGCIALLCACARTVVARASDGRPAGIVFHAPKPYLLVTRLPPAPPGTATQEARVILLPDLEHPQHLHVRPGAGSVEATLTLVDGMLAAYDEGVDGRGAETLEAAGQAARRILSSWAALDGSPSSSAAKPLEGEPRALYEIVQHESGEVTLRELPEEESRTLLARARLEVGVSRSTAGARRAR